MHFGGSRRRRAPEREDGLPKVDPDALAKMLADHTLWVESNAEEGRRLVLNEADLEGAQLGGAILNNADFSYSFLFGAHLDEAHLGNAVLEFTNLSHADLSKIDLRHANLTGANLRDAKAGGADFGWANLSYADVRRLVMSDTKVYRATFLGTRGLFGRTRAITGQVINDQAAVYTYESDFMRWPLLRSIGTLRLFGASYAAFMVITMYGTFVRWYNERAAALSELAARDSADQAGVWVERLSQLPVPAHLGWQLLMIGLLAIGATLYQVRCPEFIRENTETRWTRGLNQPLIEYRSAACTAIISRYTCFICYLVGGTFTLSYLVWRGFEAIRFLVAG